VFQVIKRADASWWEAPALLFNEETDSSNGVDAIGQCGTPGTSKKGLATFSSFRLITITSNQLYTLMRKQCINRVRIEAQWRRLSRVEKNIETGKPPKRSIGWLVVFYFASAVAMISDLRLKKI
jgi:hypothetical protein